MGLHHIAMGEHVAFRATQGREGLATLGSPCLPSINPRTDNPPGTDCESAGCRLDARCRVTYYVALSRRACVDGLLSLVSIALEL